MAEKTRTKVRYVDVNASKGGFVSKIISGEREIDFSDIKILRALLSNEKARILYILKNKKVDSIYALAKMLKRDIKSVRRDLHFLERFGFVDFFIERSGKRERIKPVLSADRIQIVVSI